MWVWGVSVLDSRVCFRIIRSVFGFAALCSLPISSVYADQPAGKAVAVNPAATIANPEGLVTLTVGSDVAMGDRVKTDRNGEVQLLFTDDTRLVVGPNSSLVIEAYLLRSKSRANNFTVRALGGSFRMITGKSAKQAYKIKTPTATIGVRGTSFDFTVKRNGATGLMLFDGEARVCGRNGRCQAVTRRCSVAEAPRNRDVRLLKETDRRARTVVRDFPYLASQRSLRRDFRVRTRGCRSFARLFDPRERPRRTTTPRAVAPEVPPAPEPEPTGEPGNPGNGGTMGNAGSSPGNNDFGDRERGRSDTAPGRGASRGNGRSNNRR
jgi:hypothetical protein